MSTLWRLRIDGSIAPLKAADARLAAMDAAPAVSWSLFEAEGDATRGYLELLFTDRVDEQAILADLGLDEKWAYNVIKLVGNYGEVFDKTVGSGSPLKIDRGLNALWTDGGLQYGPPIR